MQLFFNVLYYLTCMLAQTAATQQPFKSISTETPTKTRPFQAESSQPDFDAIHLERKNRFEGPLHAQVIKHSAAALASRVATTGHLVPMPTMPPSGNSMIATCLASATAAMTATKTFAQPASRPSMLGSRDKDLSSHSTQVQTVYVVLPKTSFLPHTGQLAERVSATKFMSQTTWPTAVHTVSIKDKQQAPGARPGSRPLARTMPRETISATQWPDETRH